MKLERIFIAIVVRLLLVEDYVVDGGTSVRERAAASRKR
jgi:hypothetical protein